MKKAKITPRQADLLLNYMEASTMWQQGKLTLEQAKWYLSILNTFKH